MFDTEVKGAHRGPKRVFYPPGAEIIGSFEMSCMGVRHFSGLLQKQQVLLTSESLKAWWAQILPRSQPRIWESCYGYNKYIPGLNNEALTHWNSIHLSQEEALRDVINQQQHYVQIVWYQRMQAHAFVQPIYPINTVVIWRPCGNTVF